MLGLFTNYLKLRIVPKPGVHFAIMLDGTQDIAVREQESFCVRYVDSKLQIHEHFLGFYESASTTGEDLSKLLLKLMHEHNLDIDKLVGQCYDGAANMSGIHKGAATRITQLQPKQSTCIATPIVSIW